MSYGPTTEAISDWCSTTKESPSDITLWEGIENRFVSIIYYRGPGRTATILDTDGSRPFHIDYAAISYESEMVSIFIEKATPCARICIAMPVVAGRFNRGLLVGEIKSGFLWKIGKDNMIPAQTELLVIDQDRNVLVSSLADPDAVLQNFPSNFGRSGNSENRLA